MTRATRGIVRLIAVAALVLSWPWAAAAPARADDTGWTIESFDARIEIQPDGRLLVTEGIDVDFGPLERRGIFRDIPVEYAWPDRPRTVRAYGLEVLWVRDETGRSIPFSTSREGANVRIRVGDPDRTVTGKQRYRIAYVVVGVLNGFAEHDELYWNVTGDQWPVAIRRATATVVAPAGPSDTTCFVGVAGSTATCTETDAARGRVFTAGRPLSPGEQLTVVFGLPKGVVSEPRPILRDRPREVEEFFDRSPLTLGAAAAVALAGLWLVFWWWWRAGRDRPERTTVVPEYEPPDGLRPAELGVLVDERADPRDVTATIVDLAVRGHLTITERPKEGLFGTKDWIITRRGGDAAALRDYERTILDGLFDDRDEVKLSELRRHFYATLGKAQRELYRETVDRRWFPADPSRVRATYAALGVALLVVAGIVAWGLGYLAGAGVVGLALGVPALGLAAASPVMPSKTKTGAELLRRTLGFRRYMEVAETERQRFAEREGIFAAYLPYAIVFGTVDRWARAFEGIDVRAATAGWYVGSSLPTSFAATDLSRELASFSSEVSTAIASTPGSRGGSGFGGGAGGGGGGGGGGSW